MLARVAYLPFVLQNDVFIDALFGVNVLQVKGAMSMALSCSVQSVTHLHVSGVDQQAKIEWTCWGRQWNDKLLEKHSRWIMVPSLIVLS